MQLVSFGVSRGRCFCQRLACLFFFPEHVQDVLSCQCDSKDLRRKVSKFPSSLRLHLSLRVSPLAADSEDKPHGPPLNGRKGKSSERCDAVTLFCELSQSAWALSSHVTFTNKHKTLSASL